MNMIWLGCCFLALFGVSELLYHKFKVHVEVTRKISHVGTGILTLAFPLFLQNQWSVFLLCFSFLLILIFSLKFNFLPSINAIDRASYGSLLYPVAVYLSFLVYQYVGHQSVFFYLPVLTLAICDPIAAFIGKKRPLGRYRNGLKTLVGSFAFFLSAFILAYALLIMLVDAMDYFLAFRFAFALSLVATIMEAISSRGFDNLTIPLGVGTTLLLIL